MMFLKEEQNKDELNGFLATTLTAMTYSEGKELLVSSQEKLLSNSGTTMAECNHENADMSGLSYKARSYSWYDRHKSMEF